MRCAETGKVTYRSPERANKIRKLIKKKSGECLSVFRCEHCRLWHLGHSMGDRQRKGNRLKPSKVSNAHP